MAGHPDLRSMSQEAIPEYLAIAHYCITERKPEGGAYGYPAALLLFCVVDAMSNYAGYPENSFHALKDIFPPSEPGPSEAIGTGTRRPMTQ
jgi:hypothetical protein